MDKERAEGLVEIGCIVCLVHHKAQTQPMLHHLTGIKYRATGKKANDEHTIGLCHPHHQGREGVHVMGMRPWEAKYGTQTELLEITNKLLALEPNERRAAIRGILNGED